MPTSDGSVISTLLLEILRVPPTRVLDVGPGHGKYGFLCREYLSELEALDCYEPWTRPMFCQAIYDHVHVAAFPPPAYGNGLPEYDLVLMIDVLEHYAWQDGITALLEALRIAPAVLVSTPHRPAEQGSVGGNIFEQHVSQWAYEMLEGVGACMLVAEHPEQLMVRIERR